MKKLIIILMTTLTLFACSSEDTVTLADLRDQCIKEKIIEGSPNTIAMIRSTCQKTAKITLGIPLSATPTPTRTYLPPGTVLNGWGTPYPSPTAYSKTNKYIAPKITPTGKVTVRRYADRKYIWTTPTPTPIPTWGISKIIDGDTFDLGWTTGEVYRVRILGIDTPEIYSTNTSYEYEGITNTQCLHSWGLKATEFAQNTLLNKQVTVITDPIAGDQDIYDRLLRYVEVDGKDFSVMLLKNGYARVYTEAVSSRMDSYLAIEEVAKINKVGLWGCSETSSGSKTSLPKPSLPTHDPWGPDKDCKDFKYGGVDTFFKSAGGPYLDPHKLDRDGDGIPCEENLMR
tara:strand:- start:106 stop:1134 length:1029 start_codon:yes stop_codon:yes gene_type:complete